MIKREVVLDTETTGLDPKRGHRVVEIGCVELINLIPSGKIYHTYLNPERDMPLEAFNVHGLSEKFLSTHPTFGEVFEDFLAFIGDSPLVIHNAQFDLKFLNAELQVVGGDPIPRTRAIDTLMIAKSQFPGSPASLDALCRRFKVNNQGRVKHGALLDAELLGAVYLELMGGRQPDLDLAFQLHKKEQEILDGSPVPRETLPSRSFSLTEEEQARHLALLEKIKKPLWQTA